MLRNVLRFDDGILCRFHGVCKEVIFFQIVKVCEMQIDLDAGSVEAGKRDRWRDAVVVEQPDVNVESIRQHVNDVAYVIVTEPVYKLNEFGLSFFFLSLCSP